MTSYETFHAIGRRTTFRSLLSHIPIIVAELATDCDLGRQGQTVYLVRPDIHDLPAVTAILRHPDTKLHGGDVLWVMLRNPRIEQVPAHIAERCWTGEPAEMQQVLASIIARHCPRKKEFGLQVDLGTL